MGGHNVPEETIRRRYHAGLKNFYGLYRQIADSWYLFDNSKPGNPFMIATSDQQAGFVCEEQPVWEHIAGGLP